MNEDSLSATDNDFDRDCVTAGVSGYHQAVAPRGRAVSRNSIARCDNRITGWRYEDGDRDPANAAADGDQDATASDHPNTNGDAYAVLQRRTARRNAVPTAHTDANRDTEADVGTNPATGAVWYPASRWSLPGHLLLDSKPDTERGDE